MMAMDKGLKAKWVAALRSGDYEQGRHFLLSRNQYCCLGVLCVVAGAEPVPPEKDTDSPYVFKWKGTAGPASLPNVEMRLDLGIPTDVMMRLAGMNDGGPGVPSLSFIDIADYIEANL